MRIRRVATIAACLAAGLLVAGCGGDGEETTGAGAVEPREAPAASAFPSARGKTLEEVLTEADGPTELVISPAATVFNIGENRYPFGVFTRERNQVSDAEVALYFARVPQRAAPAAALDRPAIGPFTARVDTLATEPAYTARNTAADPDRALAVYLTEIEFPSNGEWRIGALIREDGKTTATLLPSAVVGRFDRVPQPGERAPVIHTPTAEDVGGDLSKIDTREPPSTQHGADFADVVGRKPVVLLFATPAFCQSRVCGPVVDVAEQVKDEFGDRVEFIQMEIYNDNDPNKGVRPQVRAYSLPSEPWAFVIDSQGVIRSAIEGAFSVEDLTNAVEEVAN